MQLLFKRLTRKILRGCLPVKRCQAGNLMQTFSQERQKLVVQSIVNLNLPIFLQMNEQVGLIIFLFTST